ncbi:MAG: T9SS type A sorting domain-containing protein [Saprospiraceae bacterium]|nr:T9SS type A sorting domain-containing protein [Saprospiraceae bacterium]
MDWVTSSEVNSDYFGVERSADGNTWEQIGQVAAAGNSNTDLAYQYIDRKLPSFRAGENIFYYRLRLTDLDGQYKYTDVRGVNFGKTSNSIVSIYPNPTTEIINVDISGMSLDAGDVTLSVYDMNGRNMISKNILGNGIELIDVDQYPAGTYNVVVQQGETIQQKKIIKID